MQPRAECRVAGRQRVLRPPARVPLLAVLAGAASNHGYFRSEPTAGRSLAARHIRAGKLIALCCVGLLESLALVYAEGRTGTTSLWVTVREEEQLELQGENVTLKIRLARDVTARLWSDNACGTPVQQAKVFTKSGTYTLPIDSIPHEGKACLCLLSSDGRLQHSLVWPQEGATVAINSHALSPRR